MLTWQLLWRRAQCRGPTCGCLSHHARAGTALTLRPRKRGIALQLRLSTRPVFHVKQRMGTRARHPLRTSAAAAADRAQKSASTYPHDRRRLDPGHRRPIEDLRLGGVQRAEHLARGIDLLRDVATLEHHHLAALTYE